ncbi:MAG: ATP-binding cassette domain-containing protein [Asticcacaulis sp.]
MREWLVDIRNCDVIRSRPLLQDINLQIAPFGHTAIIGPNGSGKSTLIRLLMRDIYPMMRRENPPVNLFCGEGHWTQGDIRQRIALVSMKFADYLLETGGLTVFDSVVSAHFGTYGFYKPEALTAEMRAHTIAALELMQIADMGERSIRELSTGQLRKVLIARAMVLRPKLLLLDEPSLGLDIAAQSDFLDYLKHTLSDATVIMVTHHLEEILPEIDHIVLMKQGRIFMHGPKAQVLTSENMTALFDKPVKVEMNAEGLYAMRRL